MSVSVKRFIRTAGAVTAVILSAVVLTGCAATPPTRFRVTQGSLYAPGQYSAGRDFDCSNADQVCRDRFGPKSSTTGCDVLGASTVVRCSAYAFTGDIMGRITMMDNAESAAECGRIVRETGRYREYIFDPETGQCGGTKKYVQAEIGTATTAEECQAMAQASRFSMYIFSDDTGKCVGIRDDLGGRGGR